MKRLGFGLATLALGAVLFIPVAGAQTQPPFHSSVSPISAAFRAQMISWRKSCPVAISDLRLARVSYWGFDGRAHHGFTARLRFHALKPGVAILNIAVLARGAGDTADYALKITR